MPRLNLYEQQTTAQGPRASGSDFGAAPAVMLFALAAAAFVFRAYRRPGRPTPFVVIPAALSLLVSIELGCNMSSWIMTSGI